MSEREPLAERIGAVLDKHVGWQMHRGQMIDDLCAAIREASAGERGWTYEVAEPARPYYDRLDTATAIIIAKEMVDEWSYEANAHDYCHVRSVLVRLIEAAEGRSTP
jgi:hypothetical protein